MHLVIYRAQKYIQGIRPEPYSSKLKIPDRLNQVIFFYLTHIKLSLYYLCSSRKFYQILNIRNIASYGIALALFTLFFTPAGLLSQSPKTAPNSAGYWLAYTGDNKINKYIGIHSELQLRNLSLEHTNKSVLIRTGLNVYVKPYAMVTLGYGYIFLEPSNENVIGSTIHENRIWQQLILRQRTRYIFMEHRYRLEQRFLRDETNNTKRTDHRLRYRFQTLYPLYSITPHLRHFFISLNNEIMINYRNNPAQMFDRNRFFAGLGYQVSPKMNFQLGYLNQYAQAGWNPKGHTDHLLQFAVSYNMDDLMQTFFTKKQEK